MDRIKHYGSDLSPNLDDFKDSNGPVEDCDVALALFNPFRYKAFDDKGMYMGYDIRNRMLNERGFNRFRLLSILKNSYGGDDLTYGLKFLGEVMHFETMPRVDDKAALERVYNQIALGL